MLRAPSLALAFVCATLLVRGAENPEAAPLDCFLVVTGGEMLEGAYPDGHTHFITRTLRPLGVHFVGSLIVDDRREEMIRAMRFATNHARLVVVTGGLGPTPNDITRETLSEFTGIPLTESELALANMEKRLGQARGQIRANLRRQCLIPERGRFLTNSNGTAAGLVFDGDHYTLVALPGPPRELQPMVRDELTLFLQQRFGLHALGASLTLRFVGVGQSQIAQTLQDQVRVPEGIVVTSLFEGGRVDFTFTARHGSAADWASLRQIETNLCSRLAEFFYAADGSTLEQVVLRELGRKGIRLALAEVGSGGVLAASLHAPFEARAVVAGALAAPSAERLASWLPGGPERWRAAGSAEDRAKALAEAAVTQTQADWALALGEGEQEDGAGPLWLALKAGDRWVTQRLTLRSPAAADRANLVTPALDCLRRCLRETR